LKTAIVGGLVLLQNLINAVRDCTKIDHSFPTFIAWFGNTHFNVKTERIGWYFFKAPRDSNGR